MTHHLHIPTDLGVIATATAAAEILAPNASWLERLGTVGMLVVALGVAVRYLVNELAKKDEQIRVDRQQSSVQLQAIGDAATKAAQDNTRVLLAELKASYDVKTQMTSALHELTATLRERNRR